MKTWKFNTFVVASVAFSLLSLYFVLVNTLFADKVLISVRLGGQTVSMLPVAHANSVISSAASEQIPQHLLIELDGNIYSLEANELDPQLDLKQITNFAKGSDPVKVLKEGLELLAGKQLDLKSLDYEFNEQAFLEKLPYKHDPATAARLEGDQLLNCQSGTYDLTLNSEYLQSKLNEAFRSGIVLELELDELLLDPNQVKIIRNCEVYKRQLGLLEKLLPGLGPWPELLRYDLSSANSTNLEFNGVAALNELDRQLEQLAADTYLAPVAGEYVKKGNKLYMYKAPQAGRRLDNIATKANLQQWMNSPEDLTEILAFQEVPAPAAEPGLQLVDVTKKLASGLSRLDIVRDGYLNYRVTHAQSALVALNGFVIDPGKEFSFHRDSGVRSGLTRVGVGVCNATTTIFRTALLAGFPITERHPHTFYTWSYEYPFYPINNVEATFFGGPVLDLKFINDLDYPVLLISRLDRSPNDGFQYHTVEAYSSPNAPERVVELTDFKRWDVKSEKIFKSSFTRKISLNGQIVKEDVFKANYYELADSSTE